MIVYPDGGYETGAWLTKDTYPGKEYYVVEEGSALANKVMSIKYKRLIVQNGKLVDVQEREPTPEEIAANQPLKTPEQQKIDGLEAALALATLSIAESTERLAVSEQAQAQLLLQLAEKGVL